MSYAFSASSHPYLSHRWEKNRDKIVDNLVLDDDDISTFPVSMSFYGWPS